MVAHVERQAPPSGGFTLLEVMITVALLASVMLGGLLVIVPVAREARIRKEVEVASISARRVLERIQASPFSDITETYPEGHVEPIIGLTNGRITVTYADPTSDPLIVSVNLAWENDDIGPLERTFTTVRTE